MALFHGQAFLDLQLNNFISSGNVSFQAKLNSHFVLSPFTLSELQEKILGPPYTERVFQNSRTLF